MPNLEVLDLGKYLYEEEINEITKSRSIIKGNWPSLNALNLGKSAIKHRLESNYR